MAQDLYVPPPLQPIRDDNLELAKLLDGLRLAQTDVESAAWRMRMQIEEYRYANVVDERSRAMTRELRQGYEEQLRQLDQESEDDDEDRGELEEDDRKRSRGLRREVLRERLADDLEGAPLFRVPDTLDQTLEANDAVKLPVEVTTVTTTVPEDNFYSPPNDAFVQSGAYTRLEPRRHEFRLVRILPGGAEDEINCELTGPVPFAERKYNALSYSAGDVKDVRGILVNGVRFWVFHSLFRALWQLRASFGNGTSPWIWIDQICINQHDTHEKAQQVLFMRYIYHYAAQTIVWIGDEDDNSLATMFSTVLAKRHADERVKVSTHTNEKSRTGMSVEDAEFWKMTDAHTAAIKLTAAWLVAQLLDANTSNLPTLALLDVFDSSWWRRCWVIQELVVSRSQTIVWGKSNMTWYNFKTVPHVLQIASQLLRSEVRSNNPKIRPAHRELLAKMSTQSANDMRILCAVWKFSQPMLRDVLCITRDLGSTDPRDRVFSVLGIVRNEYDIQPDYQSSTKPETVFHEVAVRVILVDRSFDILSDREPRSEFVDHVLPSWVPDLSKPLSRRSFASWHFPQQFSASSGLEATAAFDALAKNESKRVLELSVVVVHPCINIQEISQSTSAESLAELFDTVIDDGNGELDISNGPDLDLLRTRLFGVDDATATTFWEDLLPIYLPPVEPGVEDFDVGDIIEQVRKEMMELINASMTSGSTSAAGANTDPDDNKLQETENISEKNSGPKTNDIDVELRRIEEKLTFNDCFDRLVETDPSSGLWRLMKTATFHAMVPWEVEQGDWICVVPGVVVPLVFRAVPETEIVKHGLDPNACWLVGPAYVHGYMDGSAVRELQEGLLEEKKIFVL